MFEKAWSKMRAGASAAAAVLWKPGFGAASPDSVAHEPEVGLGLTEANREYIHAWRLLEARDAGLVFKLDVEGVRNERLDGDTPPEHRVGLGFGWRLEGAVWGGLEVRFESSRLLPANDDPESRIGVRLTARW